MDKTLLLVLPDGDNTAYVEFKDMEDLENTFTLEFDRQNVIVYVWRSVVGLHRNTNFKGDYVGAYVAYPARQKTRGLFGEIHLVKEHIGAGYVAHEIQHFTWDWVLNQNWSKGDIGERLALLAGNVTRDFWMQYLGDQENERSV